MSVSDTDLVHFEVDGVGLAVPAGAASLLEVLRDQLGRRAAKDGCSPQGQCGCCTVLIDGAPRVACVTPVRRVGGRRVTTLDGFAEEEQRRWGDAFCAAGASQCGFCTPGIVVRLAGLEARGVEADDHEAVSRALAAHLCRCTGWRTIIDAWDLAVNARPGDRAERDLAAATRRATIEGRAVQRVDPEVALGRGGFADDTAPDGALVAVSDGTGGWVVGETLTDARAAAGKVQGRRTTLEPSHPLAVPPGAWVASLRTQWVEPAYLETDASWCRPGGQPASPLANGGAFGAKVTSVVTAAARELADRHGRAVRVLLSREDTVRMGPKRPPVAAGVRADGSGVIRVVRTPGIAATIRASAPTLDVEEVDVVGPPTSVGLRAAGWAELAMLRAGAAGRPLRVTSPDGSEAEAEVVGDRVRVRVECGDVLDEVVLRSYCIGAAHMALGWVRSEGLSVDGDGVVNDLTVRSFGVLRATETPMIEVELDVDGGRGEPVNGSDAVFAAVAAAAWIDQGCPQDLPAPRGAPR